MTGTETPVRQRRWLPWVVLVVVGICAAVIAGRPAQEGPPFDPGNPGPRGTKALVDVLRELGADVEVTRGAPPAGARTALLVRAEGEPEVEGQVRRWVDNGGTLILLDPDSDLNPVPASKAFIGTQPSLQPACDAPAVADVHGVLASGWEVLQGDPGAFMTCFPIQNGYGLVGLRQGSGTVIVIGTPQIATNRLLSEADNAVLLVRLLAPSPGTHVALLAPPPPGMGRRTLSDLVGPRLRLALLQLLLAFVVLAWAKGRRLGQPIEETMPAPLPASELVVALGNLLRRTRRREVAARLLREDLRRDLAVSFGVGPAASTQEVAAVSSDRTRIPEEEVQEVLDGARPASEAELLELSERITDLHDGLLGSTPRMNVTLSRNL